MSISISDDILTECDGDVLFALITWGGSHWHLVILDLRASKKILFVDPLGASAPDVLHTAVMSCFLDADFVNFLNVFNLMVFIVELGVFSWLRNILISVSF